MRARSTSRIGAEMDVGELAEAHTRQVVLIHVADYPDVGKIGDGEQVGRIVECLDAAGVW